MRQTEPPDRSEATATLIGRTSTVTFDGHGVLLRYSNAFYVNRLFRALGERHVPVAALRRVDLTAPQGIRRGVLRLVLHPGVDPVLAVIGDEPADLLDPYRIWFDESQREAAYRLRDLLEQAIAVSGPNQVPGFLLPVPLPRSVRSVDAAAEFNGRVIRITWRFGVYRPKTASGPMHLIPLSIIEGIERLDPSGTRPGYLRIRVAGDNDVVTDAREDPYAVLLDAFAVEDSILFTAAVRAALARPLCPMTVHWDAGATGDGDFVGIAEQDGEKVGLIHAHRSSSSPRLWEIDQFVTPIQDQDVCDALLGTVLRRASESGGTAVTYWVADWIEHRETYENQGFHLTGKWRTAGTDERREEWQIRAVLRPDPQFWESELLDVLGDVAPGRPSWWYVVRAVGALLLAAFGVVSATVAVELFFKLRLNLETSSWAFIVSATMLIAFAWPFLRAGIHAIEGLFARSATVKLRKDGRSPVLYLRSFQDDPVTKKPTRIGSLTTEEKALVAITTDIGPFIGVGRADRALGLYPAEVDDWQPAVTWLLARARLVVLRCGTGKWLSWELEQAIKIIRPEQLLILAPADEKAYREFQGRAAGILPNPLPQLAIRGRPRNRLAAVIYFSPGWHPQTIPLWQALPLRLMLSLDTRLALQLRPILRQFAGRRARFWARRLLLPGLVAITILIFFWMGPLVTSR